MRFKNALLQYPKTSANLGWGKRDVDGFVAEWLRGIGKGKPGISVARDDGKHGMWVFRDEGGKPQAFLAFGPNSITELGARRAWRHRGVIRQLLQEFTKQKGYIPISGPFISEAGEGIAHLHDFHNNKEAGVTDTEELDAYDSELARDLMALHDEVNLHPSRDYDAKSDRSVLRYYNYTLRAARSQLVPAIAQAAKQSKRQKDIEELLEDAEGKFQMAEHYGGIGQFLKTTSFLEDGLSYLHDAIDIIRQTTREVPAVRTYRPMTQQQPAWGVR